MLFAGQSGESAHNTSTGFSMRSPATLVAVGILAFCTFGKRGHNSSQIAALARENPAAALPADLLGPDFTPVSARELRSDLVDLRSDYRTSLFRSVHRVVERILQKDGCGRDLVNDLFIYADDGDGCLTREELESACESVGFSLKLGGQMPCEPQFEESREMDPHFRAALTQMWPDLKCTYDLLQSGANLLSLF